MDGFKIIKKYFTDNLLLYFHYLLLFYFDDVIFEVKKIIRNIKENAFHKLCEIYKTFPWQLFYGLKAYSFWCNPDISSLYQSPYISHNQQKRKKREIDGKLLT